MKVVHLLGPLRPSGMERMLVSAAAYFGAAGVESVVVGQGVDHPFADDLCLAGYKVRAIPPVKSMTGLRHWMSTVREEAPDVVHIHPEQAFAASVLGARLAVPSARILRTFHNYFQATGWWAVKRRAQAGVSDRFVSTFIALAEEMARHEQGFGRDCVVIPNWIDDRFLNAPDPGPRDIDIVIVGNCSSVKNHALVLRLALDRGWTVAHLGGEGDLDSVEARTLEALADAGLLRFRGVGEPLDWMVRSRVYAMPSTREGFSIALAEALSLGLECVVADSPGFEWAQAYPLVRARKLGDGSAWAEALDSAMRHAAAGESKGLARRQRDRARRALSAEAGVARYLAAYGDESSTPVAGR